MDMSLSKLGETVKDREACHSSVHGIAESDTTEWLSNNSKLNKMVKKKKSPVLLEMT